MGVVTESRFRRYADALGDLKTWVRALKVFRDFGELASGKVDVLFEAAIRKGCGVFVLEILEKAWRDYLADISNPVIRYEEIGVRIEVIYIETLVGRPDAQVRRPPVRPPSPRMSINTLH